MRIRLFVDDEDMPRTEFEPPGTFDLDTHDLADGPHRLVVQAGEEGSATAINEIPFTVRNGPGIAVFGLKEGETVRGRISLLVNAYSSRVDNEFDPVQAETPAPIPTWAFVLSLVVAAWAIYYVASEYRGHVEQIAAAAPVASRAASPGPEIASAGVQHSESAALGEQIYGNYCAACHQLTGQGLPGVFPPLSGNPVVNDDDPGEHIRTILEGLVGKEINGVVYASPMPPFAEQLSDEEIAAVVNHERQSWGNRAPRVEPADVAVVRSGAP